MRYRNNGRLARSTFVLVLAVAGTTLAVSAATGALASTRGAAKPHGKRWAVAILAHRDRHLARSADVSSAAPPGAMLAAVVSDTSLYVWQRATGETCLVNLHQGGTGGAVCGPTSSVEEGGMTAVHQEGEGAGERTRVVGLLPNGVEDVTSVDGNGATEAVPVRDNVFAVEGNGIASVRYTLPNGVVQAVEVTQVIARTTKVDQAGASASASN
jgi:hypothetical protein